MATRRRRLGGTATALVAIPGATLGLLAALPAAPAQAQASGVDLKVLSPQPGDSLGAKSFAIKVAFQSRSKSPVISTELWVDGVQWAGQQLKKPQTNNVLSFVVDSSSLGLGTHEFLVKVYCANGEASQIPVQVEAGDATAAPALDPAGEVESKLGGPEVSFETPFNGRHVQGSVEFVLDAPKKNGVDPYVTIYVDKQFKTLKNYPPYTYTWDSTTVPNGYHTIEATGYVESSQASTTRRIKVYVDNPGGNTAIQKELPDLSATGTDASAASAVSSHPAGPLAKRVVSVGGASSRVARTVHIAPVLRPEGEPLFASSGLAQADAAATVRSLGFAEPKAAPAQAVAIPSLSLSAPSVGVKSAAKTTDSKHRAQRALRHATAPKAAVTATEVPGVAGDMMSASAMMSIATPTLTVKPSAAPLVAPTIGAAHVPTVAVHMHGKPMLANVHPLRSSPAIQIVSSAPLASVSSAQVPMRVAATGSHRRHASAAGMRTVVRPNANGILDITDGTPFQVAFDGQQIAFDVPPRVEAGLPLAPFRQIFEHTGGQVEWHPQGQVVRAINADREVVITVGSSNAQVNGQSFSMDRPAFIDRGRTIVPLSFVGQALDVKVKYDPITGHLEINSK